MQGSLVWGQIGYYALQERNVTSEIVSGLVLTLCRVEQNTRWCSQIKLLRIPLKTTKHSFGGPPMQGFADS